MSEHFDPVAIAEEVGAQEYFTAEQVRLLDEWADQSLENFRMTADVFLAEMESKCSSIKVSSVTDYEIMFSKCQKEFQAFCILNRKVQKKNEEIENFAAFFHRRNHKKTYFGAWQCYARMQKYLRNAEERAMKFYRFQMEKKCLKSWYEQMMEANKTKIRTAVLGETDNQITKVQADYEKLIANLEATLEAKLLELKKEEEEHKLLHDKYETMYSRAPREEALRT